MKKSEKAKNILLLIQTQKDSFYRKSLDDKSSIEKRIKMAEQWDKDTPDNFGPVGNPYKDYRTTERLRELAKNSYKEYEAWKEIFDFATDTFLTMIDNQI